MQFDVGSRVLLSIKNLRITRPNKKLSKKYVGPFEIIERVGKLAYRLKLPIEMRLLYPVFHVSLLEPYTGSLVEDLPAVEIDFEGEEVFESEAILDIRTTRKGEVEYLVK